jgi:hypothetical protein
MPLFPVNEICIKKLIFNAVFCFEDIIKNGNRNNITKK